MNNRVTNCLLSIVQGINFLIPKSKRRLVFYSYPDYSDNCRAMYEYMTKVGIDKSYNITWVVRDVVRNKKAHPQIRFVRHRSLKSLWAMCRSRYIIRTHSFWGNRYIPKRQVMCIAWHGMPLKRIGIDITDENRASCDFILSTAKAFDKELMIAMGGGVAKCIHTGLPRNDRLFAVSSLKEDLQWDNYDKIILWMPTFRVRKGTKISDGTDTRLGIPLVDRDMLQDLNKILNDKNYLLILKLHPWASDKWTDLGLSNIINFGDKDLPKEYTLYDLIGQADALITDYSSVYIDYLLLDRPIGFVIDDVDEYREKRGFVFEPVEEYMPGEKIYTYGQLVNWLESLDIDDYADKRKHIRDIFHENTDDNSSYRVLKALKIL